jgi:capsular polysaccharide biosynthesis protein
MNLLAPPSSDDLNRLLKAWRFWLAAALIGGLLGAALYFLSPPPYRALASVQVDFNIEEAYKPTQDKQAFYYLEREVRKLQALAFSDSVLQSVADEVGGVTIAGLRDGILLLSQPGEADWHFFAEDRDSQRASGLASAWAKSFTTQVRDAATASMTLQAFHATILNGCATDCVGIESQIAGLETRAQGISPYVEVSLLQTEQLPVSRKIAISTYILIGAVVMWVFGALIILFVPPRRKEEHAEK